MWRLGKQAFVGRRSYESPKNDCEWEATIIWDSQKINLFNNADASQISIRWSAIISEHMKTQMLAVGRYRKSLSRSVTSLSKSQKFEMVKFSLRLHR